MVLVTLIHRTTGDEKTLTVQDGRVSEILKSANQARIAQGLIGYEVYEILD